MAKPKKSAAKSKKKPAAKAARKPAASRRAKKPPARALSPDEVRGLVKPPPNYLEIIALFVSLWSQFARYIRSGDTSPAQMKSKAKKSDKSWQRELALQQKQDAQMRPVRDARLRLEADTWSAFLNLWDIAKALFDDHPEIAAAMAPVLDMMTNAPKAKKKTAADPTPPA